MLKIENTEVMGWEHAIRGMRNPKNSWDRSDSEFDGGMCSECAYAEECEDRTDRYLRFNCLYLGPNDHKLMTALRDGGPVHAKYRRMITVYLDITAPLYWWKEYDTYKVGTVANSCSTMHKIHAKEFTLDDFSHEHMNSDSERLLQTIVYELNRARDSYIHCDNIDSNKVPHAPYCAKNYWWQMIQLLPSSYNQKRTVMLNYEVLANIYRWRRDHKLDEWHTFCDWIESLPYSELITGKVKGENNERTV